MSVGESPFLRNPGTIEHPLGGDVQEYITEFGLDGAFGVEDGSFYMPLADGSAETGGWDIVDDSFDDEGGVVLEAMNRQTGEYGMTRLTDFTEAQGDGLWRDDEDFRRKLTIGGDKPEQELAGVFLTRDQTGKPFLEAMTVPYGADIESHVRLTRMPLAELRHMNPTGNDVEKTQRLDNRIEDTTRDPRNEETVRLAATAGGMTVEAVTSASREPATLADVRESYDNAISHEGEVGVSREQLATAAEIWKESQDVTALRKELSSLMDVVRDMDEPSLSGIVHMDQRSVNFYDQLHRTSNNGEYLRQTVGSVLNSFATALSQRSSWFEEKLASQRDDASKGFANGVSALAYSAFERAVNKNQETATTILSKRAELLKRQ